MANTIVDATNIDTTVFSYTAPKAHASGGKVVNLRNKHFGEALTLAMPLMLTWGAQEGKEQATGNPTGKWSLALQFPSAEYTNPDAEACLNSMKALEEKVKADAMANSVQWFGKEVKSAEVIDEKFNVMLRYPKKDKNSPILDYDKPPTLTVKIPQWSGVWKPEIYDEDGEPLYLNGKVNSHLTPLEFLKPKSHVICLIVCGGLWFVNGKVSITWNLKQAIVQKPKATMEGTCFLKPKATDKERMKSLPPPEEDVDPDGVQGATIVADSDDEGESKEYVAPTPVAAQAPPVVAQTVEETPAQAPVAEEIIVEEVKPKKKLVRKKSDA
jgi:hypothetical protein